MKKFFLTIFCAAVCAFCVMAQSVITHVVDRGETLQSIASKYGTTQEQIIKLNPQAAQFVYVGMELKIPASNSSAKPSTSSSYTDAGRSSYSAYNSSYSEPASQTKSYVIEKETEASAFNGFGVFYNAPFEEMDNGVIGIQASAYGEHFGLAFDIGLDVKNFSYVMGGIGPSWGITMGSSAMLAITAQVCVVASEGENYDTKYSWGARLLPTFTFKLGGLRPRVGVGFPWTKGQKEIQPTLFIGLGLHI